MEENGSMEHTVKKLDVSLFFSVASAFLSNVMGQDFGETGRLFAPLHGRQMGRKSTASEVFNQSHGCPVMPSEITKMGVRTIKNH